MRRARSRNRSSYLRIQAIHLMMAERPELRIVAQDLFRRAMNDPEAVATHQFLPALQGLARSLADQGLLSEAVDAYHTAIAWQQEHPGEMGTGPLRLELAALYYSMGDWQSLERAVMLLEDATDEVSRMAMLRSTVFDYLALLARVLSGLGQVDAAAAFANEALAVAAERNPGLSRYPGIGVPDPAPELVTELRGLAGQE